MRMDEHGACAIQARSCGAEAGGSSASMARDEASIDPTLATDAARAAELLFELASTLLFLGHEGGARPMHLRALALKPQVDHWMIARPSEAQRTAVLDEIVTLQRDAARLRQRRSFAAILAS